MKKSLLYLILFCLVFCMICTACAKIPVQNTDGSRSTSGSASTDGSQSTSESESTSSSQPTSVTDETSATTTEYRKPYEVCHTSIRKTEALQTEAPELQEKIDRNGEEWAFGIPNKVVNFQNKVIVQIGSKRDVPYIFRLGGGQYFVEDYIFSPTPDFMYPYFSDLQSNEKYMPVYTYTGTEEFTVELNDKIYSTNDSKWEFEVRYLSGEEEKEEYFHTLEEMYEALPKGKYYVMIYLEAYGNYIFGERGNYICPETMPMNPAFIVELK